MLSLVSAALVLAAPSADAAFDKAIAKFTEPESVTLTYTARKLSGDKAEWRVKMLKPNMAVAESETMLLILDGADITEMKKPAKTYKRSPQTTESLAELVARPDMLPLRLFLDKNREWLDKQQATAPRSRNGVALTGTKVTLGAGSAATFYVAQDGTIGVLQVDTTSGTKVETLLIDKVELAPAPVAADTFAKALPADAKEEAAPVAPLSEAAKAELAKGWIPYRMLTWQDFRIKDGEQPGKAWVGGYLVFDSKSKTTGSGNNYQSMVTEFEVRSGIDLPNTWRASKFTTEPTQRLQHLQGLLDIQEARARMLRAQLPKLVGKGSTAQAASDDLKNKMLRLNETSKAKQDMLLDQYNNETNFGSIKAEVDKWYIKIQNMLKKGEI